MATKYITPENDQHWLALRMLDVTSTEVSALFGMSPYKTAFELWHDKRAGNGAGIDDNERMQAGRHIEPAIASLVAERYGVTLSPMKQYATDETDRMGASFDYLCDDGAAFGMVGPGIVECKNVDGLAFKRGWQADECPDHIEIQLQHQLELTRHAWGAIAALVGGNKLVIYARARDAQVGAALRHRVREFWRSVDAGIAPDPVMPQDAQAVILLNSFADGTAIQADDDLAELLAEYDSLTPQLKKLEQERETLKALIFERAGEASSVIWTGGKFDTGITKPTEGTLVTPEMVGTRIGSRNGFRRIRSYPAKATP